LFLIVLKNNQKKQALIYTTVTAINVGGDEFFHPVTLSEIMWNGRRDGDDTKSNDSVLGFIV